MEKGRIILVSGAPGTGKSTASALLAAGSSYDRSVHLRTDDFYHHLSKGAVPPHLEGAHEQNKVVMSIIAEAAKRYAEAGYEVIVDGIVGPWFIGPWKSIAEEGLEVCYIVLRASKEATLGRALSRAKLDRRTNAALVEAMWGQFSDLGSYERHVLDTTGLTIEETVQAIKGRIDEGSGRLQSGKETI